ncbi:hypothetical protein N7G274_000682 [Stereocaulon virgatum]|uniref:Uncharacterized protein n=1 Tax=Stereocaulon virgatum TaxID=373712 RepID=A0ABR4AQX9_9LECA
MIPLHASVIFKLFATGIFLALPSKQDTGDTVKDASMQQISPKFQLLAAPLYRNVTAGQAWVYPGNPSDLGTRSVSCECFNANFECCTPETTSLGPFCMPIGSSCCTNTFCVAGDTCCGNFCCPATTTCKINVSASGCCPVGAICDGPSICYDLASSNCTNTPEPKQQCCPADLPYCRHFPPTGLGCYASSTISTASTTRPSMTAATMSGVIFESTTPSLPYTSIVTVTVSVVRNGGSLSLEFPKETVSGAREATKYVLSYGSNSIIPLSVDISTISPGLPGSHLATSLPASSTTPSSPSSKQHPTSSSSTPSPLCFNTALQTPAPCPTSSTSTTNSAAAATTLPTSNSVAKSQAPRTITTMLSPTHLLYLLLSLTFIILAGIALGLPLYYIYIAIRATLYRGHPATHQGAKRTTHRQRQEITVVEGSGRRLSSASRLDREIVVVRGSGRPWKEGLVVSKEDIRVVKGSGRVIGEEMEVRKKVANGKTTELVGEVEGLGHVFLEKKDNV